MRYVLIWDDGDNGWSTPSAIGGCCHTYQSRSVGAIVHYAIAHSPGVRAYATRSGCLRALVRNYGVDPDDVRDMDRVPAEYVAAEVRS